MSESTAEPVTLLRLAAVVAGGLAMAQALRPRYAQAQTISFTDTRIKAQCVWPASEAALKAAGVPHRMHIYPGTQHGFHNNSTPRYHEASARLAWDRTIAFFKKHLA
jgi:carboxymethylenebutenolidase